MDLCSYTTGTLASLPALCGYVFIGAFGDMSLSAGMTGADPFVGFYLYLELAARLHLALTVRFDSIVRRLGVRSQIVIAVGD